MSLDPRVQALLDKQDIHELVLRFARAVDRQDVALLRTLFTPGATASFGDVVRGGVDDLVRFLEGSFGYVQVGAHYVCNHLVELDPDDPDRASGEAYAVAYHLLPGPEDTQTDFFLGVRYLDHYRRHDGAWRFASRDVVTDVERYHLVPNRGLEPGAPQDDQSYAVLAGRLFARVDDTLRPPSGPAGSLLPGSPRPA